MRRERGRKKRRESAFLDEGAHEGFHNSARELGFSFFFNCKNTHSTEAHGPRAARRAATLLSLLLSRHTGDSNDNYARTPWVLPPPPLPTALATAACSCCCARASSLSCCV